MTQLPFWKRWGVQTAASLSCAILVAGGTHLLIEPLSPKQSIAVVFGVWTVEMIFGIAYSLHSLHVNQLDAKRGLEVIDVGDCLLLELQSKFREIAARTLSGRPNHVFIDYCHRSLEQTLSVARSAQSGELEVRDHHFDTVDKVLAAFEGCRDRTFRCIWLIEEDAELFDTFWRRYMECLIELSRKRFDQRVRVRILFVFEDPAQLERLSVKAVLGFVTAENGFAYRLILRPEYEDRLRDGNLNAEFLDFGIYGDHLLFRTTSYEPQHIGRFSVDLADIRKYLGMHNAAMEATQTMTAPTDLPTNVSVESFLRCDELDAIPVGTLHGVQP